MNTRTPTTYLDPDQLPYLFCPGCGHGTILDHLNNALIKLSLDPHKVVIITDIGCAGLSDRYFATNAFHGLHGRSVTYATGIKLANPDLNVIVLIGDGGCGIGGHHLLNAARRNIGVTVLVFNNLNYGMTGGEHSVTTPPGGITSTTSFGQLEQPLDICGTAALNGASFVARTTAFDKSTPDLIAQAIQNEGFSIIDIWELCTAHFVPYNRFGKKALEDTLEKLAFPTGIILNKSKTEYSVAYSNAHAELLGKPVITGKPIHSKYSSNLLKPQEIILAGAAGAKISSAASIFGYGAVLSGLWISQRDDYPVTVKSGHSIAEFILSPQEITYTSITKPDLMVVLFPEGLTKSLDRIEQLTKNDSIILSADLPDVVTHAQKIFIDFKKFGGWGRKVEYRALIAMTVVLKIFETYPLDALKEAITLRPRFSKENLAAVEAGEKIEVQYQS
jgi:pyruvate/2-oxoacid:ferredoxin oxidoreductase beta subunit/Pyruvate/2-oxoacid:ferredoxin oxidoreductase gamma subunit